MCASICRHFTEVRLCLYKTQLCSMLHKTHDLCVWEAFTQCSQKKLDEHLQLLWDHRSVWVLVSDAVIWIFSLATVADSSHCRQLLAGAAAGPPTTSLMCVDFRFYSFIHKLHMFSFQTETQSIRATWMKNYVRFESKVEILRIKLKSHFKLYCWNGISTQKRNNLYPFILPLCLILIV